MYEDTTGHQNTTTHHSPPLLSVHNSNALLSAQQAAAAHQQSAIQPPHTPHQSSQTNGTHTNGTVASAQPQQIVTPSAASDSPVSPPTGMHARTYSVTFILPLSHAGEALFSVYFPLIANCLFVFAFCVHSGPLHIPAIPAAKRPGYEDASLLRQPWGYDPPFDYNYTTGYPYSIERDRKVFYPSYPDAQYAQVSERRIFYKFGRRFFGRIKNLLNFKKLEVENEFLNFLRKYFEGNFKNCKKYSSAVFSPNFTDFQEFLKFT